MTVEGGPHNIASIPTRSTRALLEFVSGLLRRYGRATVAEALNDSTTPVDSSIIKFPTRKPGPRSPASSGAVRDRR